MNEKIWNPLATKGRESSLATVPESTLIPLAGCRDRENQIGRHLPRSDRVKERQAIRWSSCYQIRGWAKELGICWLWFMVGTCWSCLKACSKSSYNESWSMGSSGVVPIASGTFGGGVIGETKSRRCFLNGGSPCELACFLEAPSPGNPWAPGRASRFVPAVSARLFRECEFPSELEDEFLESCAPPFFCLAGCFFLRGRYFIIGDKPACVWCEGAQILPRKVSFRSLITASSAFQDACLSLRCACLDAPQPFFYARSDSRPWTRSWDV